MCAICSYVALWRPPRATVSFSCSVPILRGVQQGLGSRKIQVSGGSYPRDWNVAPRHEQSKPWGRALDLSRQRDGARPPTGAGHVTGTAHSSARRSGGIRQEPDWAR